MTRKQALDSCRYAGYHKDHDTFTRIFVENRISYLKAHEAWSQGVDARLNGVRCTCRDCQKEVK